MDERKKETKEEEENERTNEKTCIRVNLAYTYFIIYTNDIILKGKPLKHFFFVVFFQPIDSKFNKTKEETENRTDLINIFRFWYANEFSCLSEV